MTKSEIFYNIVNRYEENKNKNKELVIDNVVMNSKEIKKNDLFIAIRGGNNYVNEALSNGAYVVYDNKNVIIDNNSEKSFYVNDSVEFMQQFAKDWRKNLGEQGLKVVAITGSNGKTTVKDMIFNLLSTKHKGKKTEGNYNNHIGLPFTLLCSEKGDEFLILEMGMSDFGEIDLLGQIAQPDISVITNIGESHLEYLKTKENVFIAKTEIIPYTKKVLVINGEDTYLKKLNEQLPIQTDRTQTDSENKKISLVQVLSENNENINKNISEKENSENEGKENSKDIKNREMNFYYGDVNFNEDRTEFTLKYFGQICKKNIDRRYKTNVLGEHNILNLTMAIAVAKQLEIEDKYIEEAAKNIVMTGMRFQKIEKGNKIYINDAYNASPMSMRKSLETFSELYNDFEKIAVLGDMLELGENEIEFHVNLYAQLKDMKVDKIYLFGPRMKYLYEKLMENKNELEKKEVLYFEDKKDITEKLNERNEEKKAILLKASRGMKLEEIMEKE